MKPAYVRLSLEQNRENMDFINLRICSFRKMDRFLFDYQPNSSEHNPKIGHSTYLGTYSILATDVQPWHPQPIVFQGRGNKMWETKRRESKEQPVHWDAATMHSMYVWDGGEPCLWLIIHSRSELSYVVLTLFWMCLILVLIIRRLW